VCDGTTQVSDLTSAELVAAGPATPPTPGSSRVELPGLASAVGEVVGTPVLWGPVAAASALVTIGLYLLRRRHVTRRTAR
jgi:hypothetical protein